MEKVYYWRVDEFDAAGAESCDPGKLAWRSDYYWRVDAVYSTGTVKGPVWSFSTASPAAGGTGTLCFDDIRLYR